MKEATRPSSRAHLREGRRSEAGGDEEEEPDRRSGGIEKGGEVCNANKAEKWWVLLQGLKLRCRRYEIRSSARTEKSRRFHR